MNHMNSRARMFAALQGERPDVLPAAPCYLILYLEERERSCYIALYRQRMGNRRRYVLDHAEDTHIRVQAFQQSYAIFKVRPDWMDVRLGPTYSWIEQTELFIQDDVLYYVDRGTGEQWPVHTTRLPEGEAGTRSTSKQDIWDTSSQLHDTRAIDVRLPVRSTHELLASGAFELPRQIVAECGEHTFISHILSTPYSRCYNLLGFHGLMTIQHDQPELFHHILQRQLARATPMLEALAAVGVHGIFAEEIFSGADSISPGAYEEFVLAYNQPFFERMRALGLLPIHYVCGDVMPRLEHIAQLDVAAIAVEESKKAFRIDIEQVIERVAGRAAVFGNIDTVRFGLHGSVQDMVAEVQRQAGAGKKARGFVIGTGSPFPLDTNPHQIEALVEAAHAIPG